MPRSNSLRSVKFFYVISAGLIIVSLLSIFTRGFNYGIDFKGGRTYVVLFEQDVKVADVGDALSAVYDEAPEVKTYGGSNQVLKSQLNIKLKSLLMMLTMK